jgi:branched-chain amino acid aminotransferase
MSAPRIMVDGVLVPEGAPVLVPLDDGLVRGDGVFEGLRAYDRRPRTPDAHLERLARSAAEVDLPVDVPLLARELTAFCRATSRPDCAVRLMLTRGGTRILREEPLPQPPAAWTLAPQAHRVTPLLVGAKTLSYAANMQANRRARAAGADEALLVDADAGTVLEAPTSTFLWLEGDRLVAPPLEAGVLDSISRRLMDEITPLAIRTRRVEDLATAEGGMLVSTVMELQPVGEVLGVARWDAGARRIGELRAALAELCRARARDAVADGVGTGPR